METSDLEENEVFDEKLNAIEKRLHKNDTLPGQVMEKHSFGNRKNNDERFMDFFSFQLFITGAILFENEACGRVSRVSTIGHRTSNQLDHLPISRSLTRDSSLTCCILCFSQSGSASSPQVQYVI